MSSIFKKITAQILWMNVNGIIGIVGWKYVDKRISFNDENVYIKLLIFFIIVVIASEINRRFFLKIIESKEELYSMKEIRVNDMNIIIRKAIKEDAKLLIEYLNTIGGESDFLTFGTGEFGKSVEQEEQFITNLSNEGNALFIIAEINGKIAGTLNFSGGLRQRTAHTGEFGVSVLKEYWGKGIGEELVKYLINWSENSGIIRKLNLRVRTDNTRGISLYKKLGFVKEGIIKRDFLIKEEFYDSLLMGLYINREED